MLHATRRLLTEDLHPLEREALVSVVSVRGGGEDAEALFRHLLGDPAANRDLLDPVVRQGDAAMVQQLHDRFVDADRLVEGADPKLLWAFGWAGLEQARPMLFRHACEMNWDTAPAAVDGLVHLSPVGLEDEVRAAVASCGGRNFFPEYLPALAGWIGDVDLIDPFLRDSGGENPSSDCMAGIILAIGLLGPAGRGRLHDLFWTSHHPSIWNDQPRATGVAMRAVGLTTAELAIELRSRLKASEAEPPHWWFCLVRAMGSQQVVDRGHPAAWRFLPPPEPLPDLWTALFGGGYGEGLGQLASDRLASEGGWINKEYFELQRAIETLIPHEILAAELTEARVA